MFVVRKYVICGPFPHKILTRDGVESFYVDYLTDLGGEGRAKPVPGMTIYNAKCLEVEGDVNGFVDLAKLFGEIFKDYWRLEYGVAYAYTELNLEEDGWYVLLLGAEDYVSVVVNGERVFTSHIARKYEDSFYAIPVKLVKGVNSILLKVGRLAGGWGFSLKAIKHTQPVFINEIRSIIPTPKSGDRVAEWIGLHVLALRDTKVKITCVENEYWNPCHAEAVLRAGERVQIPLFIMSKKEITDDVELELIVEAEEYKKHFLIPIKVSRSNHVIYTYRSQHDGSVHRYGVKIPSNFNMLIKYPVVLILHGFKGLQMYSEIYGDKDWIIAVGVTARDGEVNYREIGLYEILEVLKDVSQRYPVDRDRIYVIGHSMGGYGAWHVGVRYPHIFAAIAPHSSRGDLSEVVETLAKIPGWSGVARLVDSYNPAKFIENLSSTPIYIAHGSNDNIVPVECSRKIAEKLKDRGFDYVYEELPEKKHWWGIYVPGSYYGADAIDRPSLESFLKSKTRRIPRRVKAVTDSIRFNTVWWIKFRELHDLARIDIEVFPEKNTIKIHSLSNVIEFSVDVKQLWEAGYLGTTKDIILEYKHATLPIPRHVLEEELIIRVYKDYVCAVRGELEICSDSVRPWITLRGKELKVPSKNVLPGPFMDIFNGKVIVTPCTDPEYRNYCVKIALHLQYWWLDYANGILRVVDSTDVIAGGLDEKVNVIAIGGPEVNRYVEGVIDYIKPISIRNHVIRVRSKEYSGENYGIALVYPNPRCNYKHYLGIMGGNNLYSITSLYRLDPTLIPDYVVYDASKVGITLEGIVESGFFDVNWG